MRKEKYYLKKNESVPTMQLHTIFLLEKLANMQNLTDKHYIFKKVIIYLNMHVSTINC